MGFPAGFRAGRYVMGTLAGGSPQFVAAGAKVFFVRYAEQFSGFAGEVVMMVAWVWLLNLASSPSQLTFSHCSHPPGVLLSMHLRALDHRTQKLVM